MSSMVRSLPASQATAALQVMVYAGVYVSTFLNVALSSRRSSK